jgi:hypothetical protein
MWLFSALPGNGGSTADNVFILSGINDGKFASATPYHTGDIDPITNLAPSYIALGDSPLKRLTTYTTGGKFAQSNLVVNGDFERINLNGQAGNLTGWKTVKLDNGAASGSVGGWGPQSGTQSPLSGVSVIAPIASFQAMLDQPDLQSDVARTAQSEQCLHLSRFSYFVSRYFDSIECHNTRFVAAFVYSQRMRLLLTV